MALPSLLEVDLTAYRVIRFLSKIVGKCPLSSLHATDQVPASCSCAQIRSTWIVLIIKVPVKINQNVILVLY